MIHYRVHSCPISKPCVTFRKELFLRWGVVSTSPNPQAWGAPFVDCPRLLIQYFAATHLSVWRPSPPSENRRPCRGVKELYYKPN